MSHLPYFRRFFWALTLVLSWVALPGQGWEKRLELRTGELPFETATVGMIALPDNSVVYRTSSAFGRFDAEGNVLWSFRPSPVYYTRNMYADSNGIHLVDTHISFNVRLGEYLFSPDGRQLDFLETPLEFFSGRREPIGVPLIALRPGNELAVLLSSVDTATLTSNGFGDSTIIRFLDQDRALQRRLAFKTEEFSGLIAVASLTDGSLISVHQIDTVFNGRADVSGPYRILHIRQDGEPVVLDELPSFPGNNDPFPKRLADGSVILVNRQPDRLDLLQYDFEADTLLGKRTIFEQWWGDTEDLLPLPDGGFVLLETRTQLGPDFPDRVSSLRRFDADLQPVFAKLYPVPEFSVLPSPQLLEHADNSLLFTAAILNGNTQTFVVKTGPDGGTFPHSVSGRLVPAAEDCALPVNPATTGLPNWWLRLEPTTPGRDTLFAYTGADGRYATRLDTGEYRLRPIPPNGYWEGCPSSIIRAEGFQDSIELDLTARAREDCSLLTVDVAAPRFLPRCSPSSYSVGYRNRGTMTSEIALLRVLTDEDFTVTQSFPAWDRRAGDTLFFNLPPLEIGASGSVVIVGEVNCENTVPGQAHCTEAHVFPDSLCFSFNDEWDGSSIEVSGRCVNDSVFFRIQNVSPFDMTQPAGYVITEDVVLHFGGEFQLESQEVLNLGLPAFGATYHLFAEQSPGHPGSSNPTAVVEGCGAERPEDYSIGILGNYPLDDGDPFVAIACPTNNGANPGRNVSVNDEDPAILFSVSPFGIGAEHLIDTGVVLTYQVDFRNETEDALTYLLITDTLPSTLDLTTVEPAGSSHRFRLDVTPFGVVRLFTQDSIRPGERVFVRYRVRQAERNAPGTMIENTAAVSFAGKSQLTNGTILRVRKPQRYAFQRTENCEIGLEEISDFRRQRDTVFRAGYDSITLRLDRSLPAYAVTIDTAVMRGDSVLEIEILMSTELRDSLTTRFGCDSVVTYRVMVTTPVSEPTTGELQLYPNPASDCVVMRWPAVGERPEVMLIDDWGRQVAKLRPEVRGAGLLLDLAGFPAGVYTLVLTEGGRRYQARLVLW